jgi:hypothetical protein
MNIEEIINEINNLRLSKVERGEVDNSKYVKCELLLAAVALIGVSYSQTLGLGIEKEAKDFWPFGNFNPSPDVNKNLIEACHFIISQIERV